MSAYLPLLLLVAALLVFYLSARDVERSLPPALRGLGLLAPLAGIVAVAAFLGRTDVALGSAMSGAVASLGLVGGLSLLQRRGTETASGTTTAWALLVPAALAVFMVGMSGYLSWVAVGALAVLGLAIVPALGGSGPLPEVVPGAARPSIQWWVLGLGILFALLAGWAAVEGVSLLSLRGQHPPAALLAATVLGPAAVMPLLSYATARARDGHTMQALGTCVSFSAGASLLLTSLVAVMGIVRFGVVRGLLNLHVSVGALPQTNDPIPFPVTLWRVECVLLLVLAVLMVPLAAGRFVPTKREGGLLLGLYVVYLAFSTVAGLRMG